MFVFDKPMALFVYGDSGIPCRVPVYSLFRDSGLIRGAERNKTNIEFPRVTTTPRNDPSVGASERELEYINV